MKPLSPMLKQSFSGGTVLEVTDAYTLVSTNPITEGVFTGTDDIARLRTYEEFAPYVSHLNGKEVLPDGHVEGDVLPSTRVGGFLQDAVARPETRDANCTTKFLHSDMTPAELGSIQKGSPFDGSLGYRCGLDKTPGTWNGKPYAERELGPYRFYHYAMVPHGAASVADGAGFNLQSKGSETIPSDEEYAKLTQSTADTLKAVGDLVSLFDKLSKKVDAALPKIDSIDGIGAEVKALQAALGESAKLTQASIDKAELAAFTEELNAANRPAEIAAKLYQEAKSAPATWRKNNPEKLLKNSSTDADKVLKGTTAASPAAAAGDSRKKYQADMVTAREKRLNGGA